jgi:hypothetical protein
MKISALLAFVFCMCVSLFVVPAHAQATRTWISGVGDDANPCSRTAPCKTWAGAIAKTAAGGEIDNMDEGGFGAITITKSITLDGGGATIASTLASATGGMVINAGSNDVVILRNLQFQGLLGNGTGTAGTPGTTGIQLVSAAALIIQNCNIVGFSSSGIALTPGTNARVSISNVHVQNNTASGTATAGILLAPNSSANLSVTIDRSYIEGPNLNGVFVDGASGGGVIHANVTNSVITGTTNAGIAVGGSASAVNADVSNTLITYNNNVGAAVSGSSATLTLGSNIITNNETGVSTANGGTLLSFKNNMITDNPTSNGTPITAVSGYSGGGQ